MIKYMIGLIAVGLSGCSADVASSNDEYSAPVVCVLSADGVSQQSLPFSVPGKTKEEMIAFTFI